MTFIQVENVSKEFKIYQREKGFINSLKSIINPQYSIKTAVDNISFFIEKGDLVGYIGPNGAGKSTTIKMLSGILYPTKGEILINGKIPHVNRKENAMNIGVVFGQRSQLFWDLPVESTFELYKKMYNVEDDKFKRNIEFYTELLEMKEFLKTPVRQLSLGQKMRANIAVALLHDPDIVYLDEPTIGLDVVAKSKIRKFIKELNKEKNITLILTTHDMDDIEEICNKIIMIDNGSILYDGSLEKFKEEYSKGYTLIVDLYDDKIQIDNNYLTIFKNEENRAWISFKKEEISISEAITAITQNNRIKDLNIREPKIEDIVKNIYGSMIKIKEEHY